MKILNRLISFVKKWRVMSLAVGLILLPVLFVATAFFPSMLIWFWLCLAGFVIIYALFIQLYRLWKIDKARRKDNKLNRWVGV